MNVLSFDRSIRRFWWNNRQKFLQFDNWSIYFVVVVVVFYIINFKQLDSLNNIGHIYARYQTLKITFHKRLIPYVRVSVQGVWHCLFVKGTLQSNKNKSQKLKLDKERMCSVLKQFVTLKKFQHKLTNVFNFVIKTYQVLIFSKFIPCLPVSLQQKIKVCENLPKKYVMCVDVIFEIKIRITIEFPKCDAIPS